jgi:hypothetical protein
MKRGKGREQNGVVGRQMRSKGVMSDDDDGFVRFAFRVSFLQFLLSLFVRHASVFHLLFIYLFIYWEEASTSTTLPNIGMGPHNATFPLFVPVSQSDVKPHKTPWRPAAVNRQPISTSSVFYFLSPFFSFPTGYTFTRHNY